jgi:hypothetical protein
MSTYEPIASQTLGSAAVGVTFSSIPQGYTDLVVVVDGNTTTGPTDNNMQFNGDAGSNYSITGIYGDGSTAASFRSAANNMEVGGIYWAGGRGNRIVQINNYSNSTTFKTILSRVASGSLIQARVGLWRNTAPITSIYIYVGASTYTAGTTFSIYGIQVGQAAQKAQGGNIVTTDGTYVYHTFTSSGSFIPSQALTADYLVVAGGGGGGGGYRSGAGGAGGLRCTVGATGGGGSLESALSLTAKSYPVLIGAGGVGITNANGTSGGNSVFGSITATGGGYGGGSWDSGNAGGPGGSGGGGIGSSSTGGAGGTRTASPVQGFNGGSGYSGALQCGGGGGGAGAIGQNGGSGGTDGDGGNGATTSISGTSTTYAGGGGGGNYGSGNVTIGGTGGGGAGGSGDSPYKDGVSGTVNTGGGAGGASGDGFKGGNGGSGIVIIRYAL